MDIHDRQVKLIGEEGQKRLESSKVLVLGCGALGSTAATQLARAGVNLKLVDRDIVEASNLQRTPYRKGDVGDAKATALKKILGGSTDVDVEAVVGDFNRFTWQEIVEGVDIAVDGLDNMRARYLLNEVSVKEKIPFVHGSAIKNKGRSMTFLVEDGPCFRCLYPERPKPGSLETCHTAGVLNPITSLIASFQANEAMNYLMDAGRLNEKLLVADLKKNSFEFVDVRKCEDCKTCRGEFELLSGDVDTIVEETCDGYQIVPEAADVDLEEIAESFGGEYREIFAIVEVSGCRVILFENGRMQVHTKNPERARTIYSKVVGL